MAYKDGLVSSGLGAEKAKVLAEHTVSSAPTKSTGTGLVATGTAIGDALQLTKFHNVIATTAASTGVKLPSAWPIGQSGYVQNNGASALNLFPPTALISINGGTAGNAVTIAAAAGNLIIRLSATDFAALVVAKEA